MLDFFAGLPLIGKVVVILMVAAVVMVAIRWVKRWLYKPTGRDGGFESPNKGDDRRPKVR